MKEWDRDTGTERESWWLTLICWVLLAAMMALLGKMAVDGVVRHQELQEAHESGQRVGRLEMLQWVDDEIEKEGRVWLAYYRAASQPKLSGFDGVVLLERGL